MQTTRRWYAEPEVFIAIAALIVSVSAVAVGLYEAALQRHHDKAEVWPHTEIEVLLQQTGATLVLENTGIGPAIVQSIGVTVDGQSRNSWREVLHDLLGNNPVPFSSYSALQHGLRPGDKLTMFEIPPEDLPQDFWKSIARVRVNICYSSVFDEHWTVEAKALGGRSRWQEVARCPAQPDSADF